MCESEYLDQEVAQLGDTSIVLSYLAHNNYFITLTKSFNLALGTIT